MKPICLRRLDGVSLSNSRAKIIFIIAAANERLAQLSMGESEWLGMALIFYYTNINGSGYGGKRFWSVNSSGEKT